MLRLLVLMLFVFSCSQEESSDTRTDRKQAQIEVLKQEILALKGIQSQIDSVVRSDFANCPESGDTAIELINMICKISKFVNEEAKVDLKGMLGTFTIHLDEKISTVNDDLLDTISSTEIDMATVTDSINGVISDITNLTNSLASIDGRLTTAESVIATIQGELSSITSTVTGGITSIDIGTENISVGPLYESVSRFNDRSRINAYVEAVTSPIPLGNNPLTATSGSPDITVNHPSHGVITGKTVFLDGLKGTKGFTSAHVNGFFTVKSVIDQDNFVIIASKNATSSGTFGGLLGSISNLSGRGIATIWTSSDGADTEVRTASYGSGYNFIIKANGDICYSIADHNATFATISSEGVDITCK